MKRFSIVFVLALSLVFSVFANGQKENGGVIEFKLAHCAADGGHFDLFAEKFVEALSEISNDRLRGTVYPAEQLGNESTVIQNVQNGVIEFTAIGHDPLAQFVPSTALLSLPFMYENHEEAFTVLDSEVGETLEKELAEKKLHILGWSNNGARVYTNNVKPLETPADFVGLKMRSPESPVNLAVTSALGGIPSALSYGEVYTALQQKTIDGQENAVINIYPSKLYEVQKYMSMTNHILSFVVLVSSEDFYNSLSDADNALVDQAAQVAVEWHRGYVDDLTSELTEAMIKEGVQVNYPADMKPFQEATKPIHTQFVGTSIDPALYEKALQILGR